MAQDFLPYDFLAGHDQVASRLQKNFEALEAKFPVKAKDIDSVPMRRADWAGASVPTDALNLDELFNRATGIAAFLGCFDILRGMRLVWLSETAFGVDVGQVTHRARFMRQEMTGCHDYEVCPAEITPGDVLIPGECEPSEGNPSGLDYGDGTLWYYVYAKLDVAGTAPQIRVSSERPVWCEGKGPEHPTFNLLRYIGALKTGPGGVIKPFLCYGNGWTFWKDKGYFGDGEAREAAPGWLMIGQNQAAGRTADIPPTADAVKVAVAFQSDQDDPSSAAVRPTDDPTVNPPGSGTAGRHVSVRDRFLGDEFCAVQAAACGLGGCVGYIPCILTAESEHDHTEAIHDIPVNLCSHTEVERQTFQYYGGGGSNFLLNIDAIAYHEPHLL
jgi:hypothetical protein